MTVAGKRAGRRRASFDGPADKDAAFAWDAEIQRRLSEIDAGTAELIDREELRRRMRARLNVVG